MGQVELAAVTNIVGGVVEKSSSDGTLEKRGRKRNVLGEMEAGELQSDGPESSRARKMAATDEVVGHAAVEDRVDDEVMEEIKGSDVATPVVESLDDGFVDEPPGDWRDGREAIGVEDDVENADERGPALGVRDGELDQLDPPVHPEGALKVDGEDFKTECEGGFGEEAPGCERRVRSDVLYTPGVR